MCETVRADTPGSCRLCGMALVALGQERLPDDEAGAAGSADLLSVTAGGPENRTHADAVAGGAPLMPGLSVGPLLAGCAAVLVLSFALLQWRGGRSRRRVARAGLSARSAAPLAAAASGLATQSLAAGPLTIQAAAGGSALVESAPSHVRSRSVRGDGLPRFDLFRIPGLRALVRRRGFQFAVQAPVTLLFLLVLAAGFFGNPDPARNIAPVLTWTIWWTWLAIAILLAGKVWCTVCPWMAISDWISRLSFWRRVRRPLGAGLRWPPALRNIWLATGLFVLLTWLELGYGVTGRPGLTAALGLLMVGMSLATTLLFERRAFCRYACLVGRVSGLYATFAATELRPADRDACRRCRSKACYRGNDDGYPCPTWQFMGAMDRNTYCTLCTECVKSCPEDNLAWNVRPPGADLLEMRRVRTDEAYLAVILLSMSAFHGLTMTPSWDRLVGAISGSLGTGPLATFTIGMAGVLALPLVLYYGVCFLMLWCAGDRRRSAHELFVRFAYSLLPIALFYHLAHNLQHIGYEGLKLVRVVSDPFGIGWDLFGTTALPLHAVIPVHVGWWIQASLIVIGHLFGIWIAHRTAASLYADRRQALLSQIPMLVAMVLFSLQSLWLLAQPMAMRTAM